LLLSGTSLAACGGEGGEAGETGAAPAASAASAVPAGEGGEGGAEGASAAQGGEAGAGGAYQTVSADSRAALRIAHLSGFFRAALAAAPAETAEAGAALAGQGMLEAWDPAAAELKAAGVNEALLRKAAQTGQRADLQGAVAELDRAYAVVKGNPAEVAKGLTGIAAGIYRDAVAGGAVDPVEYQHAYGAALAAQALGRRDPALASARADLDRFAALWPAPVASEDATKLATAAQVQAQASRVELALSGA
jgi:hypothetical protein